MAARKTDVIEEQADVVHLIHRPARTNREGRSEHLSPQNLGKMTVYTFKDVVDYAYTQGFRRFGEPIVWEKDTISQSGKPMTTVYVKIPAVFLEPNPNTGQLEEVEHWGFGDANYENCGSMVAPHHPRMADTRARGRALAHALSLDANFAEEMGDSSDSKPAPAQRSYSPPPQQSQPSRGFDYSKEDPSKYPPMNGEDGWYCEVTNQKLKDTAQSSAGRKAQWAMEKTGRILSYEEQQKALGNG